MEKDGIFSSIGYAVFILAVIILGFIVSLFFRLGNRAFSDIILLISLCIGTLPLLYRLLQSLAQKKIGVDIIAIVAIAVSLYTHQYGAGIVIAIMLSGGEALETYAQARAKKELTHLLSKAPSIAHRKKSDSFLDDVLVEEVEIGDSLIVKPGEVVPVDGIVCSGRSNVDESAITGESLPVEKKVSSHVYSGSVNNDRVLEIRAIKKSSESKYQIIVALVHNAQTQQAPVVRLADRYALAFNIFTFSIAGLAWFFFHDSARVLAILVVASPCPLILATPIAILSGISRAASRGVVVKSGAAMERLGEVTGLAFDKTGTLTLGIPEIDQAVSLSRFSDEEILCIATSIDQLSAHVFARALVRYAQGRSLHLEYPKQFKETFGMGVRALLHKQDYLFGKLAYLQACGVQIVHSIEFGHEEFRRKGKTVVYLATKAQLLGYIVFSDKIRPETKHMFESIRRHNLPRIVMLTGDKRTVAENISRSVGIKEFHAEMLPEQKVEWLKESQKAYGPMAMVGDGVNDAPALVAASVGIVMGGAGGTAASEAGDVIIMTDNIQRVHDAIHIAQSSMNLAKQGIAIGMSVSGFLMISALLGYIEPVAGAVMQEVLDICIILNALRLHFERVT